MLYINVSHGNKLTQFNIYISQSSILEGINFNFFSAPWLYKLLQKSKEVVQPK